MAWLYIYGEFPDGEIDHINGNKADNRICNLRCVDHFTNMKNYPLPRNNKSGIIGVSWYKALSKWEAKIQHDGKSIHLGYFDDLDDAAKARKAAEEKYSFHANHGRSKSLIEG